MLATSGGTMVQFGQYAPPRHTIVHISDTHFLSGSRPLYGSVDTDATLARVFAQLERSGVRPEAIVITGDLADLGETDAYARLRELVEPAAERLGAQIIWVMGNHDERAPFARELLGEASDGDPLDRVYDLNGLRVIALDSTVPGFHHGELSDEQLDWLRGVLSTPAADGTILALHHPPIPSPVELMAILELHDQPRLADVLRGSDVRAILAGHLHYSTHGTFAGIPVSVASATCYTIDVSAPLGTLLGVDAAQAVNLVNVYDSGVVHSIVPIGDPARVAGFSDAVLDRLAALTPAERRAAFSDKSSTFNQSDAETSAGG
jgi:Icc protein